HHLHGFILEFRREALLRSGQKLHLSRLSILMDGLSGRLGAPHTSFFNLSLRRVVWQDAVMGVDAGLVGLMGPQLELLLPQLDEKSRRLVLGAVARAAGEGGITAVAKATGASWQTVANGAGELASGDAAAPGRVRRPGGGRKKLEEHDPRLIAA